MKKFRVHVSDPLDSRPFYIAGETLQDAVESNKNNLLGQPVVCGKCEIWDHAPRNELEVIGAEYDPGILGGRGGWRSQVKHFDHRTGKVCLCEEWIYADRNGDPVTQ